MKPVLTKEDLIELTTRSQYAAQKKCLISWGVSFLVKPDGSVLTTWQAVEDALSRTRSHRPNLDAIRNKK